MKGLVLVTLLSAVTVSTYGQVRLSTEQADKLILEKPEPAYPPLAKQMRLQGTMKVEVTVSESGSISSTKVVSGHPLLATAAVDAVKKYRYKPYMADGKSAPFITTVEVSFSVGIPKEEYDGAQSVNEKYFKKGRQMRSSVERAKLDRSGGSL